MREAYGSLLFDVTGREVVSEHLNEFNYECRDEKPAALVRTSRQRAAAVASMRKQAIEPFRAGPRFADVRRIGTITALDVKANDPGYLSGIGPNRDFFKARNLLLRPFGNTIYVMPPYRFTTTNLDQIYTCIRDAADVVG
ncbi:hypothetical protein H8A95_34390 [Bradyrhizobium sp. Pear76]|uniref:hypothetical protein n=1 Tax=Bradyrhizobium oropedii TaxID=1571201 RepID=UPI001E60AEBC|nr:hypothetical protein [Bradyrhizobium oropedii]MCC8967283.1 hypothetical protein [Bradyrhizobium oropedii]